MDGCTFDILSTPIDHALCSTLFEFTNERMKQIYLGCAGSRKDRRNLRPLVQADDSSPLMQLRMIFFIIHANVEHKIPAIYNVGDLSIKNSGLR